ncbi:hypothetical protein BSKO_01725 [Bryopsis sp. KO-2023]|nr:hypothetical protein BSKO_01725 [Bryopsis sp. KO-2023]
MPPITHFQECRRRDSSFGRQRWISRMPGDRSMSDNASSVGQDDASWDDWEGSGEEAAEESAQSLFENEKFPSPEKALRHDADKYGFDLPAFAVMAKLDDYDVIKLVNYIRMEVSQGNDVLEVLKSKDVGDVKPWNEEKYLKPVLEDDALLFFDYEAYRSRAAKDDSSILNHEGAEAQEEMDYLRTQNQALMQRIAFLKLDPSSRDALQSLIAETGESSVDGVENQPGVAGGGDKKLDADDEMTKKIDESYFDSYSQVEIHREMLGDKVRTEAYRDALEKNPSLIKGKAVLDVGCGTGVLSLFACRGGASRVVAVDGSKWVAGKAEEIATKNGCYQGKGGNMQVLCGKFEEIASQLEEKVDVIVSEWMGYALLFETMLDTVLHARDHCLRPGGAILPDLVTMHIAGATEAATGLEFWKDVYGLDMSPIRDELFHRATHQAIVQTVDKACIITDTFDLKKLDLMVMSPSDVDFNTDFEINALDLKSESCCHAIVMWFDALFSDRFCKENPVILSTSPYKTSTHWTQTVLALKVPVIMGGEKGALKMKGRLSMSRGDAHRSLIVSIEYRPIYKDREGDLSVVLYEMSIGPKTE